MTAANTSTTLSGQFSPSDADWVRFFGRRGYVNEPKVLIGRHKAVGVQPESMWLTAYVSPDDVTAATVMNLQPGHTYHFMVLARSMKGQGRSLFSAPVKAATLGKCQILSASSTIF